MWHKLITSFSLVSTLIFGAVYLAKQSNKHRDNEKKARWFALEAEAFDSFINSLYESTQKELKKEFAKRLFGQSDKFIKELIDKNNT